LANSTRLRRKWLFRLVLLAITAEICGFLLIPAIEIARTGAVPELFLARHFAEVDDEYREGFLAHAWDAQLGWGKNSPDRPMVQTNRLDQQWIANYEIDGSRRSVLMDLTIGATSYGDSFTHCSEVQDDETWQHFFGEMTGIAMKNFGAPGFGTGQALMRFRRHVSRGIVAPVTVLGIYEDDVSRTVNRFRPLYASGSPNMLGFKPAFRIQSGKLVEFPNAYNDPTLSIEQLRDLAFEVSETDYWASRKAEWSFPFSWSFLRVVAHELGETRHRKGEAYWAASREPRQVMDALARAFDDEARRAGSRPVVLLIPDRRRMRKQLPPAYIDFRDRLREERPQLTVVDIYEQEFDPATFNLLPFKGHASPTGNRIVAEALSKAITAP